MHGIRTCVVLFSYFFVFSCSCELGADISKGFTPGVLGGWGPANTYFILFSRSNKLGNTISDGFTPGVLVGGGPGKE